jgi:Zn-dependent M28 family amino/carboxypeptidase
VDNGTSLAWMLSIAKAFTKLEQKPLRSVLFFAPTSEEQGLLGSAYYCEHPLFDLNKTVCDINNDLMLPYGRMKDVMVTGFGQSELDTILAQEARKQDRYIFPDPNPHTGMYYRADHFSFAKVGVPAIFARGNCDSREHGKEWALEKEKDWINNNYHKPTDEYNENWDLTGVQEDAVLFFNIGLRLANDSIFPKWNEGSEFKSLRK